MTHLDVFKMSVAALTAEAQRIESQIQLHGYEDMRGLVENIHEANDIIQNDLIPQEVKYNAN